MSQREGEFLLALILEVLSEKDLVFYQRRELVCRFEPEVHVDELEVLDERHWRRLYHFLVYGLQNLLDLNMESFAEEQI